MIADWSPLDRELDLWQQTGLHLPLWWRDDDATEQTEALGRLEAMARRFDLPVHLAVIPKSASASLVDAVGQTSHLLPVVHGWAHENNAPADQKKAEFGVTRPVEVALSEAEAGLEQLRGMFGETLLPVFVPPWNRVSADLLPWMAGAGYGVVSTFGPRKARLAAPGLEQVNTHVDPIDWHGSRSLLSLDGLLTSITDQLADRREGRSDRLEPFGLLTHHLVHDDAIWAFCETLLDKLLSGAARPWHYDARIPHN